MARRIWFLFMCDESKIRAFEADHEPREREDRPFQKEACKLKPATGLAVAKDAGRLMGRPTKMS